MFDSLSAWPGIIFVCTCSCHSDVTFSCFSTSGITWGCGYGVSTFIFPDIIFGNFSVLNVTVKFLILIGWKNYRLFCWVKYLKFIWVCLYNRHPQRLCIGEWIDWGALFIWFLLWFTSWILFWTTYLIGTLRGTAGGFASLNISTRVLNASLCTLTSVNRWLDVARLCRAYIKSYAAWKVASTEDICGMLNLFWETLLCLILSTLLSWGCMPCEICSVPLMVLFTSHLLHVVPMMRGNFNYYELLLFYQVGITSCGWNQIIRICEYRLICREGFLIVWANLDWFFPSVRVCPKIEDESICLR